MSKHALPPQERYTQVRGELQVQLGWVAEELEIADGHVATEIKSISNRRGRLDYKTLAEVLNYDPGEDNEVFVWQKTPGRHRLNGDVIIHVSGSVEAFDEVVCRLAALTLPLRPEPYGKHAHKDSY